MAEQNADPLHSDADPPDLAHLREMLPWYAAHALSSADQAWFDQLLEAAPPETVAALRADIAWLQSTAMMMAAPPLPTVQIESGLDRLMERIAADRHEARSASTTVPKQAPYAPNLLRRWRTALSDWLTPRSFGLALVCMAVFVIQAGFIGALLQRTPAEQIPLSGVPAETMDRDRVVLLVAFRAGATEADLRALLLQHKAQIIAGPSALGLYRVAIPAARAAAVAVALQHADALVESVQQE